MYYYVIHLLSTHSLFTYHFYWHKYYFPSFTFANTNRENLFLSTISTHYNKCNVCTVKKNRRQLILLSNFVPG